MKHYNKFVFIGLLILPLIVFSRKLEQKQADSFIKLLVNNGDISEFIDPQALYFSNRLGIQYQNVINKFLISYDIEDEIRGQIKNHHLDYQTEITTLEDEYSLLSFQIPILDYHREFYFRGNLLVSPISNHTRDWFIKDSKHFRFILSNTLYWNSYCTHNLEQFYQRAATLLGFSAKQEKLIEQQKIYYILCHDEAEIKDLTGFITRGMYNLANDIVITTFNAHYHELVHLLINFKLKNLPLYTSPFFQEGLAVALGGRGGKEPQVILNLGLFLQQSKMLSYRDLLSKTKFNQYDASMSYPLSGLYNLFLIKEIGIENYLKLYKKYSGSAWEVDRMVIPESDLPDSKNWDDFVAEYADEQAISLNPDCQDATLIFQNEKVQISRINDRYYFKMKDTLLVTVSHHPSNFISKKFQEIFPAGKYCGEKYLILVNVNEISIYNLYTGNLIANFVSGFTIPARTVPVEGEWYEFTLAKSIFDEDLKDIMVH
jgi:hypothetical protein